MSDKFHHLRELALKAQTGDKESYRIFLQDLYPYICNVIKKKVHRSGDYEDLAQECMMAIHRNLASYQKERPIGPWISAILRYKIADYYRILAKRNEQYSQELTEYVTNTTEIANIELVDPEIEIQEALNELPEKLRRAIVHTQLEGRAYKDVALKEGISEVALRKRVSRAYIELRKMMLKGNEVNLSDQ